MPKGSVVEELLSLEQQQLARELAPAERRRWIELSSMLTGARRDLAEKRRSFRVNVVRRAEVLAPVVDPEARVLSVSTGGLSLVTTHRLEPGTRVSLRVSLPVELQSMVEVDADVRWVSEQAGAQSCHGLAFAAPAQSLFGRLEPLLRRHLYLKLEANLSRYASYFEALPEAVLCLDGADTIVAANARARDALGAETLDGVHVLDVVDDGSKTALIEALGSVRRHACQIRCELALRSQAHAPREAALGPLPGAGDGGGVILTCRDAIEAEEDPG